MTRVLVTGATGCVGRHVLPLLVNAGWDVHAIQSRQTATEDADVTWHRASLLDTASRAAAVRASRATHLLHLAWYIAPGKWAAAPENLDWVEASLALVREFHHAGGQRVVTAGSCLEYDWNYGYCAEDRTPFQPHTLYGTCKHAAETLSSAYTVAHGMSHAAGRIFFLYGPHEHPDRLVASVVRSLIQGEPARCSHGNQIRDYLFVEDVARAFVSLLESDVTGALNIASGRPIALKDIVTRAGHLLGRPDLIKLGAIPAAATDTPLVVADMTRTHRALAWRPEVDLDTGLERTAAWWRRTLAAAVASEARV